MEDIKPLELLIQMERFVQEQTEARNEKRFTAQFLMQVGYEMKNLLAVILGYTTYLLSYESKCTDFERLEYYQAVKSAAIKLVAQVNDLIDLGKMHTGPFDLNLTQMDLCAITAEIGATFQEQAEDGEIKLFLDSKTPNLIADERLVRQIIRNIIIFLQNVKSKEIQLIVSPGASVQGKDCLLKASSKDTGWIFKKWKPRGNPGSSAYIQETTLSWLSDSLKDPSISVQRLRIVEKWVNELQGKTWLEFSQTGDLSLVVQFPSSPVFEPQNIMNVQF
jgi:hypothetical protein